MKRQLMSDLSQFRRRRPWIDTLAVGRWENEGGSAPTSSSAGPAPTPSKSDPIAATNAIDSREDELMSRESSDGRPPGHRRRTVEWWWFGGGALVIVALVAGWAIARSTPWRTLGAGVAIAVLLLVSVIPVLAAGLLRGREHRRARKTAQTEREPTTLNRGLDSTSTLTGPEPHRKPSMPKDAASVSG